MRYLLPILRVLCPSYSCGGGSSPSDLVGLRQDFFRANVKLIDDEIAESHVLLAHLKKSRQSKEAPLKLAQTRLYQRTHRPGTELCYDTPYKLLVEEVNALNGKHYDHRV